MDLKKFYYAWFEITIVSISDSWFVVGIIASIEVKF